MSNKDIKRVNYFTGEALLTDDFKTEQNYFLTTAKYHNRYLYTWGIAYGLEVKWQPGQTALTVTAGMAIDSEGNEIILCEDQSLIIPTQESQYYLTISYQEILTDYTEETFAKGFKRITAKPKLDFLLNLKDPGTTILLAIITTATNRVSSLEYGDTFNQRQYCGAQVGSINFYCNELNSKNTPSINVRKDLSGYNLYVDSAVTQFTGNLTTNNLSVNSNPIPGMGTISSKQADNSVVFDQKIIDPNLSIGDLLISTQFAGAQQQKRIITGIQSQNNSVSVDQAFNPPLNQSTYLYVKTNIAHFTNYQNQNLLKINEEGSIKFGDTGNLAVDINVNGQVNATSFVGDGSKLSNVLSLWQKNSDNSLAYNGGAIGIGTGSTLPTALLQIQLNGTSGTGTISCNYNPKDATTNTVFGSNADFTQLSPGMTISIGNATIDQETGLPLPILLVVDTVDATSSQPSFTFDVDQSSNINNGLALVESEYTIIPSLISSFGTQSSPSIFTIENNASVNTAGVLNVNGTTAATSSSYTQLAGNVNCFGLNVLGGSPDNSDLPPQTGGAINCGILNVGPYGDETNGTDSSSTTKNNLDVTFNENTVANFYGDVNVYGTINFLNENKMASSAPLSGSLLQVGNKLGSKVKQNLYRNVNDLKVNSLTTNSLMVNDSATMRHIDIRGALSLSGILEIGLAQVNIFNMEEVIEYQGSNKNISNKAPTDGILVGSIISDSNAYCMMLNCIISGDNNQRYANCFAGPVMMDVKADNMSYFVNNSFTMPIQKGEKWSITVQTSPACDYRYCIYFIPFGAVNHSVSSSSTDSVYPKKSLFSRIWKKLF